MLRKPVSYFDEVDVVVEIASRMAEAMNYAYMARLHVITQDEYEHAATGIAQAARQEGVTL